MGHVSAVTSMTKGFILADSWQFAWKRCESILQNDRRTRYSLAILILERKTMSDVSSGGDLLGLTAEIVSAHVSNNPVSVNDLPTLIVEVHRTLASLGTAPARVEAEKKMPAVAVKKSITPDYLICLEDGKKLKMLKRHLQTSYGMTPDQYRDKWGLPPEYPMVAPNYAKHRSSLAKQIGLGTQSRKPGA
jgi:predicted transcriptional regulator